jgi:hypothetical protein
MSRHSRSSPHSRRNPSTPRCNPWLPSRSSLHLSPVYRQTSAVSPQSQRVSLRSKGFSLLFCLGAERNPGRMQRIYRVSRHISPVSLCYSRVSLRNRWISLRLFGVGRRAARALSPDPSPVRPPPHHPERERGAATQPQKQQRGPRLLFSGGGALSRSGWGAVARAGEGRGGGGAERFGCPVFVTRHGALTPLTPLSHPPSRPPGEGGIAPVFVLRGRARAPLSQRAGGRMGEGTGVRVPTVRLSKHTSQ